MSSIEIVNENKLYIDKSCSLIVKCEIANIEYNLENGVFNVIIFNDYDGVVTINDSGLINNATLNIKYLELNNYSYIQNTNIKVNDNSELYIDSTYLGVTDKKVIYDLYNCGKDSIIEINNNIVCLNDSSFSLDCIGTIINGAKRSKCHQKNHCLTLDKPKKARVLPVLNIDENDVEASHSLSSGTLDEEIMFYMNSRGLTKSDALGLLLRSYLIPNESYYDGFIDSKLICEMASRKVNHICSM